MTNLRAYLVFAIALLLVTHASSTRAAAPSMSPLAARLTIQIKDAPLTQFVDTLSEQTKTNFILAEGIENMRVTTDAKDQKASDVLKSLLAEKGLVYRRIAQSNTYVITSQTQNGLIQSSDKVLKNNRALETRITTAVKNAPLRTFLDMVTGPTKVIFTLASGLEARHVTLDLKNVTAREALEVMLAIEELQIAPNGKSDFTITPVPKAGQP